MYLGLSATAIMNVDVDADVVHVLEVSEVYRGRMLILVAVK